MAAGRFSTLGPVGMGPIWGRCHDTEMFIPKEVLLARSELLFASCVSPQNHRLMDHWIEPDDGMRGSGDCCVNLIKGDTL